MYVVVNIVHSKLSFKRHNSNEIQIIIRISVMEEVKLHKQTSLNFFQNAGTP